MKVRNRQAPMRSQLAAAGATRWRQIKQRTRGHSKEESGHRPASQRNPPAVVFRLQVLRARPRLRRRQLHGGARRRPHDLHALHLVARGSDRRSRSAAGRAAFLTSVRDELCGRVGRRDGARRAVSGPRRGGAGRCHEADRAMAVLGVVPAHEVLHPARASLIVAWPRRGQRDRVLAGANSASEKALSLLTRGRLKDAMTPSRSIVTFMVTPFIGLPLSACRDQRAGQALLRPERAAPEGLRIVGGVQT